MKLDKTSDTGAGHVHELADELVPVFERIGPRYPDVGLEVFTCFRCLPEALGRETFRRYDKAEHVVYLDMAFSEDRYVQLSKEEQRRELSHTFYDYLADSLRKYRFPGLDVNGFLLDLRAELRGIGWLKESWEIYLCADNPAPDSPQLDECACITCILDPSKGKIYASP